MKNKIILNLVENGIFPIVKNKYGEKTTSPDTGYDISGTLQGEGKLIGIPSIFVRTSGCNLKCAWKTVDGGKGSLCDTPYSSFNPERSSWGIEDILKTILVNIDYPRGGINNIIISGGEPTIQIEPLVELVVALKRYNLDITLETNATIFNPILADNLNLISMSPKLSSSTPHQANLKDTGIDYKFPIAMAHEKNRKNIEVIQKYIDSCHYEVEDNGEKIVLRWPDKDFQLKFVISSENDIKEIIEEYLLKLKNVNPSDVVLMPEGVTQEAIEEKSHWVIKQCIKNGWRYTPRLHIDIWGNKKGI